MEQLAYRWTTAENPDFRRFYQITEEFYNSLVGGLAEREGFVPFNLSEAVSDVIVVYHNSSAVACAGLKRYSDTDAEIKRVWVEPEYRRKHIAAVMMDMIETRAAELKFDRTILQTREVMTAAVSLYQKRGYVPIDNYPPYDELEGAVCFAKDLTGPTDQKK